VIQILQRNCVRGLEGRLPARGQVGIFLACFATRLEEEIWDMIGESQEKVKYFKLLPKEVAIKDSHQKLGGSFMQCHFLPLDSCAMRFTRASVRHHTEKSDRSH
jgi:hypothetical protein